MVELARPISNDCFQPLSPRLPRVCTCVPSHFSHIRLCDPMDCSPPGSSVHGDSPGKNTRVGCCVFLQGIFLHPGIEPASLMSSALAGGFFATSTTWEALKSNLTVEKTNIYHLNKVTEVNVNSYN